MKVLSIETSCDETGISILECTGNTKNASFKVLADSLNSQIKIHAPYGGVFPALAKREHLKNLPILLERALKKAKLKTSPPSPSPYQGEGLRRDESKDLSTNPCIDLIAVTSGPGLEPALWTGIVFAKELSKKYSVPLIPVNHMEGHILSVFGNNKEKFNIDTKKTTFPILALLVSGGHTELVLINNFGKYKIIGETLDDAAGEAFDKVARMLELPYPGGPEISKLAEIGRAKENHSSRGRNFSAEKFTQSSGRRLAESPQKIFSFALPRPMLYSKNFDFSFSGLKTAVLYLVRDLEEKNPKILEDINIKQAIAMEFENAVVETLVHKTKKAIEQYAIKSVIVAGGVSANKYLKKEMQKLTKNKQTLYFPDKKLSGDNSVMIGIVGYLKFLGRDKKGVNHGKIKADGNLKLN